MKFIIPAILIITGLFAAAPAEAHVRHRDDHRLICARALPSNPDGCWVQKQGRLHQRRLSGGWVR